MKNESMKIEWKDSGREPQCPSDPIYPDGTNIRLAEYDAPTCVVDLPYPAPRCGVWLLTCEICGLATAVTAAGRPDDPRSVEVPCAVGPGCGPRGGPPKKSKFN